MKRYLFVSLVFIVAMFSMPVAWAQVYYPPVNLYSAVPAGNCLNLYRDLSVGSRGSDVSTLQSFLVSQNYHGGGSWMITGFFGAATRAAVMIFQQSRGIPASGVVDAQTRAMMQNCGTGTIVPPVYSSPVSISSLSTYGGTVGTTVTIFGNGFDPAFNTVYFGATPLPGNTPSYGGNTITFVVPSNATNCSGFGCYSFGNTAPGVYPVSVMNARGTSNRLTFTVSSGGAQTGCGYFGAVPCGGYTYGVPTVTALNPNAGAVGTTVTIYGTSFSPRSNSVNFGTGVIAGLGSFDGTSLSFTVPSQLTGYGSQTLTLGTYNVSVTNEFGLRSNSLPFTVTSFAPGTMAPSIQSVSGPTTLQTGTQGTWTITIHNPTNSYATISAKWGDEGLYGSVAQGQTTSSLGQQTFTFTHTYYQTGTYAAVFTATNAGGQSNTSTATVIVSGSSTSAPALHFVSPNQGRPGSLVALSGTGFSQSGNTVRFGNGGTTNVTSTNNGTLIYYTIPYWTSPCDLTVPGMACGAPVSQVTPGTYQISVSNSSGQSTGALNFTVLP